MANNHLNPNPLTEADLKFRHRRVWVGVFLALTLSLTGLIYTIHGLLPLRAYYFREYLVASFGVNKSQTVIFAEVLDHGRVVLALTPDVVVSPDGHLRLSQIAVQYGRQPLRFTTRTVPTAYLYVTLRDWIYQGRTPPTILFPAGITSLLSFILLPCLGFARDVAAKKRRVDGILRRGPKLFTRHEFNRTLSSDGLGFETTERPNFVEFLLAPFWRRGHFGRSKLSLAIGPLIGRGLIRIPYQKETNHILLVGATGTGKSQLLTQYLLEIQDRGDTAVIYDPDGEFLAQFYNEDRGDIVLNPRDSRCPYWAPSNELASNVESYPLAESLFPDPPKPDEKNTFFVRAPRLILARLFEHDPTPGQLIDWLKSKAEIDKRVKNSELEELLAKGAGPQRSGVLASLAMALNAFRLLPPPEGRPQWSALSWSEKREGWIFITSDEQTRSIQLPLITMWIDTLLHRLMTRPDPTTPPKPVWFIIDELASMRRLPSLQDALTRARKYQIKTVFGFQSFSQMQELYGQEGAKTIIGMPSTGIYLRTKDPDAAEWVSKSLGEQESLREKASIAYRGAAFTQKTTTYSIAKETERVASASEIQELPDLNGFMQFNDAINRFRIHPSARPSSVPAFLPRDTSGFVPLSEDEYTLVLDGSAEELPLLPEDLRAADQRPQGGGSSFASIGLTVRPETASQAAPKIDPNEPLLPDYGHSTLAATAATMETVELANQAIRSGHQASAVPNPSNANTPSHAQAPAGQAHIADSSSHMIDGHSNMAPNLCNVGDVATKLLETVEQVQGHAIQEAEELAQQNGFDA